jgi:AcrR family transcriptional regulator
MAKPVRADAARSMARILEAAERVLARDPGASLERIADESGVARATLHRRFSSRADLLAALTDLVNGRLRQALEQSGPYSAPPLVALHQMTAAVLSLKIDWRFAMDLTGDGTSDVSALDPAVTSGLIAIFERAREGGLIRRDVDMAWVTRVYLALMHEVTIRPSTEDVHILAGQVIDTLFNGVGPARAG